MKRIKKKTNTKEHKTKNIQYPFIQMKRRWMSALLMFINIQIRYSVCVLCLTVSSNNRYDVIKGTHIANEIKENRCKRWMYHVRYLGNIQIMRMLKRIIFTFLTSNCLFCDCILIEWNIVVVCGKGGEGDERWFFFSFNFSMNNKWGQSAFNYFIFFTFIVFLFEELIGFFLFQ